MSASVLSSITIMQQDCFSSGPLALSTSSKKRVNIYLKAPTDMILLRTRLHKLWYPSIRDTSTWSKFGAHGEHRDVFLFSNLGAL